MEDQQRDSIGLTEADSADDAPSAADATESNRSRRGMIFATGAAAAAFVASGAFSAAALQPYLADRARAESRMDVARTAAAAVTALWTYTPETIDTLPNRAGQYLSGDFNAEYRKFVASIATPNKQAQVTNDTDVVGVGVEALNHNDATALVFTNTTATSPMNKGIPSLKYVGYRLDLKRSGSRWFVTKMATVSFIDLTPQI
ncbi:hypothetical protein [Mycolicibacterium sp.]|uniref:hypothetical protein n=1 Tax=Mycolicibacterium sp. TaxID=2320850 RepID=UPI0037CC4EDD